MGIFRHASLSSQQGSAIIFAMGLSLLVSALSVALLLWLMLDIRRLEQLTAGSDRLSGLEIMEAMAAEKINQAKGNWRDPWEYYHQDKRILSNVQELSGRININTLFKRVHEKEVPPAFVPNQVIKRLLENSNVSGPDEVIRNFEQSGKPVFGISDQAQLQPAAQFLYAADLDEMQVNINSTTPEVLASILGVNLQLADSILSHAPFESMQDIINILAEHELRYETISPLEAWLSVEGKYYLLETQFLEKRTAKIYSILYKDKDNSITLLWRSWGSLP